MNYLKLSEVAERQHVLVTGVVLDENNIEGKELDITSNTKINTEGTENNLLEEDDALSTDSVIELISDEMKDENFTKNVSSVIETLRKELGNKSKTAIKHFCAYICFRLETREGVNYVPTNSKDKVNELNNMKTYKKWFLNKVGLSQTNYDMMMDKGNSWHWRSHVKETYAEKTTQTILGIMDMFPKWLADVNKRKKGKQTPSGDTEVDDKNTENQVQKNKD